MYRCFGLVCCAPALAIVAAQTPATNMSATLDASVPAITINATVHTSIGTKHEDGTLVLKLSSDGSFDEHWSLPSRNRSFHAGPPEVGRTCTATDDTGAISQVTTASCYQAVPWFAPWVATSLQTSGVLSASTPAAIAVASASPQSSLVASPSMTTASTSSKVVYQLTIPAEFQSHKAVLRRSQLIAKASSMTVSSDPATGLPDTATFADPGSGYSPIQNTISYSDYSVEGRLMVPHHITRALQGTIVYDIHVTSVTLN